ncbi:glycosyl hydrolase family 18 protein [Vibrio coralliirubri]|uniref:glycosyl hydrolase family 18 protein n=4 Tax=Vibrio coralliirubri TaxID=1516159 RepID=UPI0021C37D8F|nr:glycosyl hydrolase family 18 protein [Vibrio coralliirubri]
MKKNNTMLSKSLITLSVIASLSGTYSPNSNAQPNTWEDAEKVFNSYQADASLLPVSAYFSNWGHYGRKFDVQDVVNHYDKLVYSFMGICGTQGTGTAVNSVESVCENGKYLDDDSRVPYADYTIVFTDPQADYQSDLGAGGAAWPTAQFEHGQENAGGLIAVLREAKELKPSLELAFSVGGWSLSEPFSRMAGSAENRAIFINSAVQWFANYPMFDQIDIDWEYPGGGGLEGNSESSDDGKNYALLIKELRMALDNKGMSNKKIAIAAGAPTDKLDASNLKALIDNGLDSIHLMSYDFMGEWQTRLAHQTNLSGSLSYVGENGEEFNSAENAINYMIDVLQIPANKIHIGYANYSRNAGNANINSVSPLVGTFTPGLSNNDSYEEGVSELFDYEGKVVDYSDSGVSGLQGFELYTDTDANADFLYNEQSKQFLSIETPRSVYAKAKFAKDNNLGGVFTWMADHDPGYHLNAARDALGYKATNTMLNMDKLINSCGFIGIEKQKMSDRMCEKLTNIGSLLNDLYPSLVAPAMAFNHSVVDKIQDFYAEAILENGDHLFTCTGSVCKAEKNELLLQSADNGKFGVLGDYHHTVGEPGHITFNVKQGGVNGEVVESKTLPVLYTSGNHWEHLYSDNFSEVQQSLFARPHQMYKTNVVVFEPSDKALQLPYPNLSAWADSFVKIANVSTMPLTVESLDENFRVNNTYTVEPGSESIWRPKLGEWVLW